MKINPWGEMTVSRRKTRASSFQRNRSLRTVKCATKTTKDTRWKHCDCRVLMDRWTLETTHSALMSAPQTTATKGDGISWLLTNDRREIYAGRRARDPVIAMSETCYYIDNVVDRGTFQWKTFMKHTGMSLFVEERKIDVGNTTTSLRRQKQICKAGCGWPLRLSPNGLLVDFPIQLFGRVDRNNTAIAATSVVIFFWMLRVILNKCRYTREQRLFDKW